MYTIRLAILAVLAAACVVLPGMVRAQTTQILGRSQAQAKQAQWKHTQAKDTQLPGAALPKEHCLRALNGACTNPVVVEAARLRAIIIPTVRVSYLGTPMGTVGGKYIPFERLFQDNPAIFGLPTNVLVQACCITRSK